MTDEATVERHADTDRNRILNIAMSDLDRIINDHDPEVDTSINNMVWDRLDRMAVEIESRAAIAAMGEVDVSEAARVLADYLDKNVHEVFVRVENCSDISVDAMENWLRALTPPAERG